jgi:hypothetical protein
MQTIRLFLFFFAIILFSSCGNLSSKQKMAVTADTVKKNNVVSPLIDTGKTKSDMNNVMDAFKNVSNRTLPDTNKLKATAADVLSTTASVLSDTGIAKMGSNNNDPSVQSAKNTLVRMRNASGISPAALDSMKKAVQELQSVPAKNK